MLLQIKTFQFASLRIPRARASSLRPPRPCARPARPGVCVRAIAFIES